MLSRLKVEYGDDIHYWSCEYLTTPKLKPAAIADSKVQTEYIS